MDKGKKTDTIDRIALVFTKAGEVLHWAVVGMMALLLACCFVIWVRLGPVLEWGAEELEEFNFRFSIYGINLVVSDGALGLDVRAVVLFTVHAIVSLSLMAMVFRNTHQILKKSRDSTPFQPDNIRMLKEIGYFMIASPLIRLVFGCVAWLTLRDDTMVRLSLNGIFMGILVFCLTRVFAHGMELEQDVDGLM